jgi:nitrate reductase NapE component
VRPRLHHSLRRRSADRLRHATWTQASNDLDIVNDDLSADDGQPPRPPDDDPRSSDLWDDMEPRGRRRNILDVFLFLAVAFMYLLSAPVVAAWGHVASGGAAALPAILLAWVGAWTAWKWVLNNKARSVAHTDATIALWLLVHVGFPLAPLFSWRLLNTAPLACCLYVAAVAYVLFPPLQDLRNAPAQSRDCRCATGSLVFAIDEESEAGQVEAQYKHALEEIEEAEWKLKGAAAKFNAQKFRAKFGLKVMDYLVVTLVGLQIALRP